MVFFTRRRPFSLKLILFNGGGMKARSPNAELDCWAAAEGMESSVGWLFDVERRCIAGWWADLQPFANDWTCIFVNDSSCVSNKEAIFPLTIDRLLGRFKKKGIERLFK